MLPARFPILAILAGAAIVLMAGCGDTGDRAGDDAPPSIALIPKGTSHEYWKSVHAGALKAARETGVDLVWKGPLREDDREEQIQIVETFIGTGIDAIVLAPLDDRALQMPVLNAARAGIPTVVIDSDLAGDAHVSFVATDNYRGGVMAARHLGNLTGGTGRVILLRYQEGSASNTKREEGFRDTLLAEFPGLVILADNQYVGPTSESALTGCENLLNRFPDVTAVFAPNEPVAFGCLRALTARGRAGEVLLVGFDASDLLIEGIRAGTVHGLVLQDPFAIGHEGVMAAVRHLAGEPVAPRIDTGVTLVTPENVDDPAIRDLYDRDLSDYLE